MTMRPFNLLYPELAERECRTIRPLNHERLPSRRFAFLESYCVEPRCDCRRVMLSVVDEGTREVAATINHAFEPPGPPHQDEPQTFLDPLNPQSGLAGDLLAQFQSMIDHDPAFHARLERHYLAWKAVVDDPAHPDHGSDQTTPAPAGAEGSSRSAAEGEVMASGASHGAGASPRSRCVRRTVLAQHSTRPIVDCREGGRPLAYVRKRGNQLAIVRGVRGPETRKVEQQILFTLYSKGEAMAALGKGTGGDATRFQALVEHAHPGVRFDWKAISRAIEEHLEVLPETYDYRAARLRTSFQRELLAFARQLALTDPLASTAARQLIDEQRDALEYLRELLGRRLAAPPQTDNEWTADNAWYWRFATRPADVPPDVEEHAADLYERQEYHRAGVAFRLLTEAFPDYAEGHNYLGLIALDQGHTAEAVAHFERTMEVGRRILPRRVARGSWWTDHRTRPYLRGLRNLALALVQAKRYPEALAACDRLVAECDDALTAAAHRASAYLDTGCWREALAAARHIHQISPGESLLAAFAAFELGREGEARALFLHAALNKPRTAGGLLGARFARPRDREEAVDHNDGVLLARTLDDFLRRRRPASRRFFAGLWEHPLVKGYLEEVALVTARWQADRQGRDREVFDRMQELRSWEFASRAWGPDGPPAAVAPEPTRRRGRGRLH